MSHSLIYILLFTLLGPLLPCATHAAGITNYPKLNTPDFWRQNTPDGDNLILDDAQINAFNRQITATSPMVYQLSDYPKSIPSAQLTSWISSSAAILDDELYRRGNLMTWQQKQSLRNECHVSAIAPQSFARYGITVRRSNLRALPSAEGLFGSNDDTEFDTLQETAVDPSEPLIILHTSQSGKFKYVQMYNYRGWLQTTDIAETAYDTWLTYLDPKQFLVVTANKLSLLANNEEVIYQMGAKIPLLSQTDTHYTVSVPIRTADGTFNEVTVNLNRNAPVHPGFLPYTRNNLIAQSFQFLHDPYGWGGLKNSVDCSSFIADIYRTVGISLPRNADEQEASAGIHSDMTALPSNDRHALLQKSKPGDVLFFDGHTMIYLGMTNNTPFIIHSLGSHTKHYPDGTREKIRTMQVVISDLSLTRYNGKTFLDSLTSAHAYR